MFLEKDYHNRSQGWIEVICGSMFSGKTEELIRRLKRAKIAKMKVEIFKPGVDTRYSGKTWSRITPRRCIPFPWRMLRRFCFMPTMWM